MRDMGKLGFIELERSGIAGAADERTQQHVVGRGAARPLR